MALFFPLAKSDELCQNQKPNPKNIRIHKKTFSKTINIRFLPTHFA